MSKWIEVNQSWKEFQDTDLCQAGVLLEVEQSGIDGRSETCCYLLGNVNLAGGACNCCAELNHEYSHVLRAMDLREMIAEALK